MLDEKTPKGPSPGLTPPLPKAGFAEDPVFVPLHPSRSHSTVPVLPLFLLHRQRKLVGSFQFLATLFS